MADTVDRLFELYVIQNAHYLLQFRGGHYATFNERAKPLRRYHLSNHIAGKTTVGTFAGHYLTKFITFDVDFPDLETAKWVTYKLAAALDSIGVHKYVISFSGNKGYHVDVFFDKALSIEVTRKLFDMTLSIAEVSAVKGGEVEFRPSGQQGVKLPLGIHQKTGNYCGFCRVEEGLRVMNSDESAAYLATIQKMDHAFILDTVAASDEYAQDTRAAVEMETAISRHKQLETYDQSESYTLSRAADIYVNGLPGPGQRHKSFLLLARLFNHNGVEKDEALANMSEWFAWQNPEYYASDYEFCARDLRECVEYVYDKNLTLTMEQRDLSVTYGEINGIIRNCPQKNHKALAYALLIHSKRWSSGDGTFFMTFDQMAESAGIDKQTAFRNIGKLRDVGVVEILQRDQKRRGTVMKKPNVYRMLLTEEGGIYDAGKGSSLPACLAFFYETAQLRAMLPRRQFEALITDIPA